MKISLINIIREYGYISEGKLGRKTLIRVDKKTWDELRSKRYSNLNFYETAKIYSPELKEYLVGLK